MQVRKEDVYQITESVWNSMLGLQMRPAKNALPKTLRGHFLTGYVEITGAWQGVFSLDCSLQLARRIATIMFKFETAEASIEDVRDALGELANIAGGNIKGLLPSPCSLALPVVVDTANKSIHLSAGYIVAHMDLECEQKPFRIMLLSLPQEPTLHKGPRQGREK